MLELKNAKEISLGKTKDGRNRKAIYGHIGPVQMLEPFGWVDILPQLVRLPTNDGYFVDGTPYYAETKDNGDRLFCPDKYDRTKYLKILAHPLYDKLDKIISSQPSQLDKVLRPSQLNMYPSFGELVFRFTNTGMYLPLVLNSVPKVGNKALKELAFDIETNLDVPSLLGLKNGVGILPAHLEDAEGNTQSISWSYKNGQLILDLASLTYPCKLLDAIDVFVGASTDDGYAERFYGYTSYLYIGQTSSGVQHSWMRFDNLTIAQGSTWNTSWIKIYLNPASTGTPVTNIYFEKSSDPGYPISTVDYDSRTLTTNFVVWDGALPLYWNQSDSLNVPGKELTDAYGCTNGAIMVMWKDDGSASNNYHKPFSFDINPSYAAEFYCDYTEPAGGVFVPYYYLAGAN